MLPIFQELYENRASKCEYIVNGHKYIIGYFLSNEIYPKWSPFIKTIPFPQGPKPKLFVGRKMLNRKDIERVFGVLQAQFTIVHVPIYLMEHEEIGIIMRVSVALYNMIVKDEHDNYELAFDYDVVKETITKLIVSHKHHPGYETYFQITTTICKLKTHARLQVYLIEEIWKQIRRQWR